MSTPSEAARLLAARRKVVGERQCAACGRVFVATSAGGVDKRRYCSRRCQQRVYYATPEQRARRAEYLRAYRARKRQAATGQPTAGQQAAEPAEPSATRGQTPSAPAPATTTPPSGTAPAGTRQPALPGLEAAPPRPRARGLTTAGGRIAWQLPTDAD